VVRVVRRLHDGIAIVSAYHLYVQNTPVLEHAIPNAPEEREEYVGCQN
jgi:hypothetical protein